MVVAGCSMTVMSESGRVFSLQHFDGRSVVYGD